MSIHAKFPQTRQYLDSHELEAVRDASLQAYRDWGRRRLAKIKELDIEVEPLSPERWSKFVRQADEISVLAEAVKSLKQRYRDRNLERAQCGEAVFTTEPSTVTAHNE